MGGPEEEDEGDWQHVNATYLTEPKNEGMLKMARGDGQSSLVFSSQSDTPSRRELLNIVRKHSLALGKLSNEDAEVDSQFWCELLNLFFVNGLAGRKQPQDDDDLVYFVRLQSLRCGESSPTEADNSSGEPFFVRRWASELGNVIGHSAGQVDWQRSFYLNLICHTNFSLTVAICSRESLQQRTSNHSLTPIYKVTKRVYASPSRANLQVDYRSKAVEIVPAYPDICFVVDDYDNTFEDVVIAETDHSYCVLLKADGGAALPPELSPVLETKTEETSSDALKVTMFSGFINYDTVRNAFEGGRANLGNLFQVSPTPKSEHLVMRGPGGRGALDVAVSAVPSQSQSTDQEGPAQSPTALGGKLGVRFIVHKAAIAAKQVMAAAVANQRLDPNAPLLLRCCLMSLSLPWDTLAHDLLYKEPSSKDS